MRTLERLDKTSALAAALGTASVSSVLFVAYSSSPVALLVSLCAGGSALGLSKVARLEQRHRKERAGAVSRFAALLDNAHPPTLEHGRRIAPLVRRTALELGFSEKTADELEIAALLHDVGKVEVQTSILDKPGPLTPEEYEHVKRHVVHGAELLEDSLELQRIAQWVKYHHERVDGRGYPEGRSGNQIPLASKILAVADAYDAMVSGGDAGGRPYRPLVSREQALKELRSCAGKQFDLLAVQAFCRAEYERTHTIH